jgi:glycosyltransferase involved in cell wall biosynthesis
VHYLLIGNGVLRDELEAAVRERGLGNVVHFAGLLPPDEIPTALVAMDVVVHASLREGIARVLPQALAAGRPAVAFDLDGAPEVVEHGHSGFIVPPEDTDGMAARVRELLEDEDRRRRFGAHGRDFVAREFPVERMVERINTLYENRLIERGLMREVPAPEREPETPEPAMPAHRAS